MWIRVPFFFFTKLLFISFEPIIGFINFKKVNPLKFQALMIKHLVKSVWASPKAGGLISGTDNLLIFSIQGFLPCLGQLTMLMYFYICLHPDPVPNFFSHKIKFCGALAHIDCQSCTSVYIILAIFQPICYILTSIVGI